MRYIVQTSHGDDTLHTTLLMALHASYGRRVQPLRVVSGRMASVGRVGDPVCVCVVAYWDGSNLVTGSNCSALECETIAAFRRLIETLYIEWPDRGVLRRHDHSTPSGEITYSLDTSDATYKILLDAHRVTAVVTHFRQNFANSLQNFANSLTVVANLLDVREVTQTIQGAIAQAEEYLKGPKKVEPNGPEKLDEMNVWEAYSFTTGHIGFFLNEVSAYAAMDEAGGLTTGTVTQPRVKYVRFGGKYFCLGEEILNMSPKKAAALAAEEAKLIKKAAALAKLTAEEISLLGLKA